MNRRARVGRVLMVSLALGALAGCNDDTVTVPARPVSQTVPFSAVVNQLFSNPANSTPVPIDNLNVAYDVDDDPTAFDSLILTGTY
jgi:hypothetical protein